MDYSLSPKSYLSLLKMFLVNEKTPCIFSLFRENKSIIRNDAELSNDFLTQNFTLIEYARKLPALFITKPTKTYHKRNCKNNSIAYGHDMISIRMLKL